MEAAEQTIPSAEPFKSAAVLGRENGLNSMETHLALRDAGILAGEPGAYDLTPEGRTVAKAEDVFTNRDHAYEKRTYDPKVVDLLDLSAEGKQKVRAEATAHKKHKNELRRQAEPAEAARLAAANAPNSANTSSGGVDRRAVIAVVLVGGAVAAYGTWKLAPRIKKMWKDRKRRAGGTNDGQHS
jgi:hypothetical protein